jgi:Fic family protein
MKLSPKSAAIERAISELLDEKSELSIREVAKVAGLSAQDAATRKTIQRALRDLEERKIIVARGEGRGRVYIRERVTGSVPSRRTALAPGPVDYDPGLLHDYRPNRDFYLDAKDRAALLSLGKVESRVRPAGTYAREILGRLLVDLSWNSSRLEGNTYSLLETQRLVELREAASGKNATETQMILNHKAAIEYIVDSAIEKEISSHDVRSVHALLSENLLGDPGASGRLREIAVGIHGTVYRPIDDPNRLREYFDLLVRKLNLIEDPYEQSFFALAHLSYLQAFEDVNKRTARLVANIPLIRKNLRPLSFVDVDQETYVKALLVFYEKKDISLLRDLYAWAYERSVRRYSAVQGSMSEPNLLKLKYRDVVHEIVRTIVLERVEGPRIVSYIQYLIDQKGLPMSDQREIFELIETEILSLHDGNVARFKVRPAEFLAWKKLQ